MNLSNTKFGMRRSLTIEGFASLSVKNKVAEFLCTINLVDPKGQLLEDKSIFQGRTVNYVLSNENRVNDLFNPIDDGGVGEFDFFWNLIQTIPLPTVALQLAQKLNERGIFN